jgi:hypothetical protein
MLDRIFAVILTVAIIFSFSFPSQAVTQWNVNLPQSSDSKSNWPAEIQNQWSIVQTLDSNYRRGMQVVWASSSSLTANAGEVMVSNGTTYEMLQNTTTSTITSGNLDTGSIADSTTYYVYCGSSSSTASSCTYYISLSNTAPSGVTYYAQLASMVTDASGNFTTVINTSSRASWGTPIQITGQSCGTTYQATADGTYNINLMVTNNFDPVSIGPTSSPNITVCQIGGQGGQVQGTCSFAIKAGWYYECASAGSINYETFTPLN